MKDTMNREIRNMKRKISCEVFRKRKGLKPVDWFDNPRHFGMDRRHTCYFELIRLVLELRWPDLSFFVFHDVIRTCHSDHDLLSHWLLLDISVLVLETVNRLSRLFRFSICPTWAFSGDRAMCGTLSTCVSGQMSALRLRSEFVRSCHSVWIIASWWYERCPP
jgi:hypothetical protein